MSIILWIIMDWTEFKGVFLKFLEDGNVTTFNRFVREMRKITDNKLKGDLFEYFCKMYLSLIPECKKKYKQVLLYSEISDDMKMIFELPEKDQGIDGIVIDNYDNVYGFQVKFRSNKHTIIPYGEMATFIGLVYTTNVNFGMVFSNCSEVCDKLKKNKNDKFVFTLFDDMNYNCDYIFWENVCDYIKGQPLKTYTKREPKPHQNNIIEQIIKHYDGHINGKLLLACGTGKTFISCYVSTTIMKFDNIFVVVPSLALLNQTYHEWLRDIQCNNKNYNFLLLGSDVDKKQREGHILTTNTDVIKKVLRTSKKIIVITTYQSSDLLINACTYNKFTFDFGIFDEAHRTAGEEDKDFTKLVKSNIVSKRMFMTATEKICTNPQKKILSMDDEKIYGKTIVQYNIKQAIENNVLVDYKIVSPFIASNNYDEELIKNKYINNNGKTFDIKTILTGIMICEAMEEYKFKHLLIFSGNNTKAKNIMDFIEMHINTSTYSYKNTIKCQYICGEDSIKNRSKGVKKFVDAEYGIVSSSRIFGEGIDIPACDSVCFSDGKSSTSDIIQYLCRCLRKYDAVPNKIGYVLVPCILGDSINMFNNDDKLNNKSFEKVKNILRAISTTDEDVRDKFCLINHNPIICRDRKDKNNVIIHADTNNFSVAEFTQTILLRIFDKSGNIIDIQRNMLIAENYKRHKEKIELIDTQNKCIQYLRGENMECPVEDRNWIKYALGNKLFDIIKVNYYKNKDDIIKSCGEHGIIDMETYEKYYGNDNMLPCPDYINNNFYEGIFKFHDLGEQEYWD